VITPDEAAEEESEILTEPDAVDVFQEECAGALAEFEPAPAEVEEPEAEEKEATEDRSKRRRRRRPGRAKSADQAETESPRQRAGARPVEPKSADEDEESDDADEESDDADEESDDADEESDDADEESLTEESLVHRGIPTWQDAVGVIISANIEARGKRPSGPPSRPRGGRGRGGHEGSRKPN
jgi:Mg-chelatase subunit ChlI